MKIYIEYVIIDNFIINYLLIYLVNITLKGGFKKSNMCFASVVGVAMAMFMPIISITNTLMLVALKLSIGSLIVLLLKKYKNISQFATTYILFVTYTFALGGMVYGLINICNLNTTVNGVLIGNFEFPFGIIVLVALLYCYILNSVVKYVKNRDKLQKNSYCVVLKDGENEYTCNGFLDTGNNVTDANQKGIVLIDKYTFNRFNIRPKKLSSMSIKSVCKSDKIITFVIDEMDVICNNTKLKYTNVCVGLSQTKFNNFDVLLHRDYVEGL